MLFDELILVLDLEMVWEVLDVMCSLVDLGMIMVVVIYEVGFVREVVDWIVLMVDGLLVEEVILDEFF